ncbi:MAG: MFS transporter [Anaerolineae bacterium]
MASTPEPVSRTRRFMAGLTRNVFVLGLVSFFTDISTEMIVPVRILFLVGVLQTPLPIAGLIEGLAESASSLLKIASGHWSDRVTSRKPMIFAGYTISNLAKPLLALAATWQQALGLILTERVGKGIRTSPRDALMADSTPSANRGKAFGFHRSMDTLGAAVGPLLTAGILLATNDNLRAVFAWTIVPGIISIILIILFVREIPRVQAARRTESAAAPRRSRRERLASLGAPFWLFTAIAAIFALGNSSDAFIFLRSEGLEHSLAVVPLMYFGYNVVYALLATPLGALSDRRGRLPVLAAGYISFAVVYAGWAAATQSWQAWTLFLVYGIYAAATEGVGKALVVDLAPRAERGSALGWYNGLTGFAALPANLIGGWLWSVYGPGATFTFGAWAGFAAAALLLAWLPWLRRSTRVREA